VLVLYRAAAAAAVVVVTRACIDKIKFFRSSSLLAIGNESLFVIDYYSGIYFSLALFLSLEMLDEMPN
jgi:hypothetical protein